MRSAKGWRLWAIERLMDEARTKLFPLYASQLTPAWLRSLGAEIGTNVEISTAVMIPKLTEIKEGAFLADDTMIGGYELGGGWMRTGETKVGSALLRGQLRHHRTRPQAIQELAGCRSFFYPEEDEAGANWWGAPPERMRRVTVEVDSPLTRVRR